MDVRTWLAGMALSSLGSDWVGEEHKAAAFAVRLADATLAELAETEELPV